jgi:aspartyl-tRNA(Asn)/glutamyl-tRNA(Gln) amidotransferase subunit C
MSSSLSIDQVEKVAALARISLTPDETTLFAGQLSEVLDLISAMDTPEVRAALPMEHTQATTNVLREDEIRPGLSRDDVLAGAPQVSEGGFLVPRILGEPS